MKEFFTELVWVIALFAAGAIIVTTLTLIGKLVR